MQADGGYRNKSAANGGVAQLVERLPCTQEVEGSIPFASTSAARSKQIAVNKNTNHEPIPNKR